MCFSINCCDCKIHSTAGSGLIRGRKGIVVICPDLVGSRIRPKEIKITISIKIGECNTALIEICGYLIVGIRSESTVTIIEVKVCFLLSAQKNINESIIIHIAGSEIIASNSTCWQSGR